MFTDDRVTLCDSSVICQYLEDRHPEPALYPRDLADRARARWLEEFADTRMGEVFIWRLFNEVAIRRFKKQCEKAGILAELRKREHYEKPSVRRKKKAMAARKRALRRASRTTV